MHVTCSLMYVVMGEGVIDRSEFEKNIAEINAAIACGDCVDDELIGRMIYISRNTVTQESDQGFWFEWFEETMRVLLSFLSKVDVVFSCFFITLTTRYYRIRRHKRAV